MAAWKALGGMGAGPTMVGLGFAIMAALAAVVVMCATRPRNGREWAIGLISTVVGSIAGGAFVIRHFGLQAWMSDGFGIASVLGIVFACGLPAWSVVRWLFNWLERRRERDLGEVIDEARSKIGRG